MTILVTAVHSSSAENCLLLWFISIPFATDFAVELFFGFGFKKAAPASLVECLQLPFSLGSRGCLNRLLSHFSSAKVARCWVESWPFPLVLVFLMQRLWCALFGIRTPSSSFARACALHTWQSLSELNATPPCRVGWSPFLRLLRYEFACARLKALFSFEILCWLCLPISSFCAREAKGFLLAYGFAILHTGGDMVVGLFGV